MKFPRKKLTFIPVLVLISAIIFPSFTALAADASYKFSAIDLKLKVPEERYALRRQQQAIMRILRILAHRIPMKYRTQ